LARRPCFLQIVLGVLLGFCPAQPLAADARNVRAIRNDSTYSYTFRIRAYKERDRQVLPPGHEFDVELTRAPVPGRPEFGARFHLKSNLLQPCVEVSEVRIRQAASGAYVPCRAKDGKFKCPGMALAEQTKDEDELIVLTQ
jgi:hypothetical protein